MTHQQSMPYSLVFDFGLNILLLKCYDFDFIQIKAGRPAFILFAYINLFLYYFLSSAQSNIQIYNALHLTELICDL